MEVQELKGEGGVERGVMEGERLESEGFRVGNLDRERWRLTR